MQQLETVLDGYYQHLLQKGFTTKNGRKYSQMVRHFLIWCNNESTDQVGYNELMAYISYCRKEQRSANNINRHLLAVRHLFDYFEDAEIQWLNATPGFNPAQNVRVKDVNRPVFHDPLSKEELEELYQRYDGKYKVILGLLVYQGLKTGEMEKLEKRDVDLVKGELYVPSTRNGCSRIMKLAAEQIMLLVEQLQNPGELLLGPSLQNSIQYIMKKSRKLNPKVRTAKHLRGSLIVHWIKTYNLRQAQYLAGHKNIISTELYQQADFEDLQEQLKKYHPLG